MFSEVSDRMPRKVRNRKRDDRDDELAGKGLFAAVR